MPVLGEPNQRDLNEMKEWKAHGKESVESGLRMCMYITHMCLGKGDKYKCSNSSVISRHVQCGSWLTN